MIKEDLEYLKYINDHIHNVNKAFGCMREIFEANLTTAEFDDLRTRVSNHDNTKFLPPEFYGYRQWFYPTEEETKDRAMFELAWEHHYLYNDHHPEHWYNDDKTAKRMPLVAVCEMFCDWLAMSMKFHNLPSAWYKGKKKKDPFILHPITEGLIEEFLPQLDRAYRTYESNKNFETVMDDLL